MKSIAGVLVLVILAGVLSGCGETLSGIGEDTSRMWRGTKTFIGVE